MNWGVLLHPRYLFWRTYMDFNVATGSWRHRIHYAWNQSELNKDFDPWISSCQCCCICMED